MVNPPREGRESTECFEKYMGEKNQILDGLKERASLLTKTFNDMERTTCNNIEGAMYAFPQVHFSEKALKEASKQNVPADFMYCMDMVNETGIMTVPGSGFGQKENDYHYRITNLVSPTEDMVSTLELLKEYNLRFHSKYE
jgi:aspartate/methionine/tyrosine aminotransferase